MKTPTALDLPMADPLPEATKKIFRRLSGKARHGAQRPASLCL